jgi:hypothetical protein
MADGSIRPAFGGSLSHPISDRNKAADRIVRDGDMEGLQTTEKGGWQR